jgi:hypothetical protein
LLFLLLFFFCCREIELKTITDVSVGKQTKVLKGASSKVPEDCCFALMCKDRTLDLECPTPEARDLLVKNFRRLLARLAKAKA